MIGYGCIRVSKEREQARNVCCLLSTRSEMATRTSILQITLGYVLIPLLARSLKHITRGYLGGGFTVVMPILLSPCAGFSS